MQNSESVAAPLTQFLKLGAYKWSMEAQIAFEKLKTTMMTLPILGMPDFDLPFEIEMDAPEFGVRVVMIQAGRPKAYFSHTLIIRD